jgi:hypothetical protein
VQAEINRVSAKLGGGQESGSETFRSESLPGTTAKGLVLVYLMGAAEKNRIPDQSGNRLHGQLLGAHASETDKGALEFTAYQDVLELNPLPVGSWWTLVVEAHFPLAGKGKQRVLASGGYRQDHVQVDGSGILGVSPGHFVGSGYSLKQLNGWQQLTVVAQGRQTVFYVGGKKVGIAKAVCREPLRALGNSTGSGSPWSGAIRSVLLWRRALSQQEVMSLPFPLTQK